jgi:SAM-dependent methyltransferase
LDTPTFAQYALCYDLVYQEKPYAAEVDYLEALLRRFGNGTIRRVYDIAAGTGSHLVELARRGYSCAGSDLSPEMIDLAKQKAARLDLRIDLRVAPMEEIGSPGRFDAILCMFSAIDYLKDRASLAATLAGVRESLSDGGLFIFDFWNAIEASRNFSPITVRECHKGEDWLVRIGRSIHDVTRQTINVEFEFLLFREKTLVARFTENHPMRYFHPREMEEHLAYAGLRLLHVCPFMQPQQSLRPNDWNVGMVATRA